MVNRYKPRKGFESSSSTHNRYKPKK